MAIFSNNINDDFDTRAGSLLGYYLSDLSTTLTPQHHYDLRSFNITDIAVPFTQTDVNFWDGYKYSTLTAGGTRYLGQLGGIETWNGGTVAKNSSYRYSYTISASVPVGTAVDSDYGVSDYGTSYFGYSANTLVSIFNDDILTGFSDPARTYFIELVLRSFPAQSAGAHFDLTNSFIDFSSTTNFDPAQTDSLAFSTSLNDVSAGGDTYLKFPRTALVNSTLTNLKAIRIRLTAIGGTATFIAQSMRMVDDQYTFEAMDINTKTKELVRSVPQAGGTEPSSPFGAIYFKNVSPKNSTYITSFNSGHNPTGNDNTFRHYFRTKSNGDHIEMTLTARDTQSRLSIYETINGTPSTVYQTPINTNILTNETYYFIVSEVNETQARMSIYAQNPSSNVTLGSLVYTTGWQFVGLTGQGLVGYSFEPYNYDFTIQFIGPQSTNFAIFESTPFNSRKLVRGATLYPITSPIDNILHNEAFYPWGDVNQTSTTESTTTSYYGVSDFGFDTYGAIPPTPSILTNIDGDIIITRSGVELQGGILYGPIFLGDSGELILSGEVWVGDLNGQFRVAIIDEFDNTLWINNIEGILTNVWNEFSFLIPSGLMPENVYVIIQHTGLYPETFKLRNISLGYSTIAWSISPDNGTTWQPFLTALSMPYSGVMFSSPTTAMLLKAVANTDQGWIAGYQLLPQYLY